MSIGARPLARAVVRLVMLVPTLASITVVGSTTGVLPVAGCAQASSAHHAAFVAEHADGTVVSRCVAFTPDTITGEQLLSLAGAQGIEYATADYQGNGKAVCQVDNEPASYPSTCWSAGGRYWAMFVSRAGGTWAYSSLGISSQTFRDGDAEGFRFESPSGGAAPASPHGVCSVAVTSAPVPTARPATAAPVGAAATRRAAPSPPPPSPTSESGAGTTPFGSPTPQPGGGAPPPASPAGGPSRSAALVPVSTGAWAAGILGVVLLVALGMQLLRTRRRAAQPGEP